jgi:hypothetical protein
MHHIGPPSKLTYALTAADAANGAVQPRRSWQGPDPVTPLDLYKHAFVSYFPPQAQKTESVRPRCQAALCLPPLGSLLRPSPVRFSICRPPDMYDLFLLVVLALAHGNRIANYYAAA